MTNHIYSLIEIKYLSKPVFKKYNISDAYIFGSYARGTASINSDIDFLINTEGSSVKSLLSMGALYCDLEEIFDKKIDLITMNSLLQRANMESERAFKARVIQERVLL